MLLRACSLALVLFGAPPKDAEPGAPAPVEQPDEDTAAAWEAAGWGVPEGEAKPEPGEAKPEPGEAKPEPGEAKPEGGDGDTDVWAAVGWGAPESDTPESDTPAPPSVELDVTPKPAPEPETSSKLRVGDVLGGSLRLTGAYLHFDDVPELFPERADVLTVALGRVLLRANLGEHVGLDFNGFVELSRSPGSASNQGTFASAGSTQSAYRTRYLSWGFWKQGSVAGQLGVDRAGLRLKFGSLQFEVGRFPVTYAVTTMFTTNDFFAPFSATAINTIYKPGVDALRLSAGLGARASWDVVGVLGYQPQYTGELAADGTSLENPNWGKPDWGRSAVLTRAAIVGAGFEWAALGGKVSQRWVAGGSVQGDAGPLTVRSEFHVGVPDEAGDGHDSEDKPIYGRVAAGFGVTFAWQNANIIGEYMFAADGAKKPVAYLERARDRYSDDLPYLGRHYAGLAAGLEIMPLLRISAVGLVNAADGSGMAGASLIYNVANESDLILGVYVPWGKGLRVFDPVGGTIELGSEFGLSPLDIYLEARVFF